MAKGKESMEHSEHAQEFKRGLGLLDSVMIIVGIMIGSGIFIVSADIARTVGSPGLLLLVWLIAGLLTVVAALSYGELAGMMPWAGGQYIYLREAYNPLAGFLYGWTFFMVIQTGTIAAVAVAFAKFTAVLIPWFGESNVLFSLAGINVTMAQILAVACIALLTGINLMGLKQGKIVQNVFTMTKTLALVGIILLGVFVVNNAEAIRANLENFWSATWTHIEEGKVVSVEGLQGWKILAALGAAMVGALFANDSWHDVTFAAQEVVNPEKTLPRSLAIGVGLVTVLYVLTNVAYILLLPVVGSPDAPDVMGRGIQFAASDRVGTAAASIIFGDIATTIMAVLIMISTFGCVNGLVLAGARVYYAMAKTGLFFRRAGELNANAVPGAALVIQAIWASLLCFSGTYSDLLDYVIFAVLVFYVLTTVGIFVLRKKKPDAPRPYKAFGYPILPGIYVLVASAICIDLLIFKPRYTWPGVAIVLLGIPVYYLWKKLAGKTTGNS
jgi:APA family basic amino acid/polyamine antiporter